MRKFIYLSIALCFLIVLAFAFIKPLRTVAPQIFGLTCVSSTLCLQDPSMIARATQLSTDGQAFVTKHIGAISSTPRIIFCSTIDCFARFGDRRFAAQYVWGLQTIVVNATGWHDHIIRHEVIHHWQAETFGARKAHKLPRWYIEGMAYQLSDDPRQPLPRDDIEEFRTQFYTWQNGGNDWRIPPT